MKKETTALSGECMLLCSISSQQRFGATDIKALGASQLSWTNCVIALRQISVTALLYLEYSRRIHPQSVRACQPKDTKKRVEEQASLQERGRGREREREREEERKRERAHTRGGERNSVLWLLLLYVFSFPWACPMQIELARSAVCST